MKLLPVVLVSLLVGAGAGVGLAYWDVGRVETRFYPPAAAGAGGASGPAAPEPAGPMVKIDSERFDFGTMQRGATETHEFTFTNTGTAPLQLEVGGTTCKCTLGEVANRPLAPGESTPVRLEWVAKNPPGSFRQVATVITNDPRRPRVELTVEGVITETVGLQPAEFLLGRVAADEAATAEVYLAAFEDTEGEEPLQATVRMSDSVEDPDRFRFEVESVPPEELPFDLATSGVRITLHAGPGLPIGSLTEWAVIDTNLPKRGADGAPTGETLSLQAPVYGRVTGDISLHGAGWSREKNLLNLGKIASDRGREAKLRLSYKGDHAADLTASLESADPEWLEVEFEEPIKVRDGVYHQPMTVRVPAGRPSVVRSGDGEENGGIGAGDARLRLGVNHPSTPELDVKVRFVIAD